MSNFLTTKEIEAILITKVLKKETLYGFDLIDFPSFKEHLGNTNKENLIEEIGKYWGLQLSFAYGDDADEAPPIYPFLYFRRQLSVDEGEGWIPSKDTPKDYYEDSNSDVFPFKEEWEDYETLLVEYYKLLSTLVDLPSYKKE